MSEAKLRTAPTRTRALSVSRLRRRACASGLTQEEMGQRIGTDAKGVRRLLAHDRKRADRLDLFFALEAQNCLALLPAAGRPCTETSSELRQCSGVRGVTPQGVATASVARKAAA